MPLFKQVVPFDQTSYIMLDDELIYVDEDVLDEYGDWEVVDSWEGYDGMIFSIEPPINE